MAKNIHDFTFKQLMSNKDFFVDFCRAYLPEEIKSRIDWETIKLYKMNTEFIEDSVAEDKQRDRHADLVYSVMYDGTEQECFLCLHLEEQANADKLITLRFLNYNSSLLVEYAETNPNRPLPVIVNVLYYHGKPSPYPYSLDIYDLFADKDLAQRYLLQPLLVDLKQLPEEELAKHGAIFPMEALYQLAFEKRLQSDDYDIFINAIVQQKDNKTVLQYLQVLLKYAAKALDCNYNDFVKRFVETLPELEATMSTMAQQLEQRGLERGMQQGVREVARSLLKRGMLASDVADVCNLSIAEIQAIHRQLRAED